MSADRWLVAILFVATAVFAQQEHAQARPFSQPARLYPHSFASLSPPCRIENSFLAILNFSPDLRPVYSSSPSREVFDSCDSGAKFTLERLMTILRDKRHEGWVRTAYPDPRTGRPLIGGGFSLDVGITPHPQHNLSNPNLFIEPSSQQLWQAAGIDLAQLNAILDRFYRRQSIWGKQTFRKMIKENRLPPDISEEEAMRLLQVSALQATHNARAYCANFDQLSASQQIALTQLVFQMGVNLEEFVQFLGAINGYDASSPGRRNENALENVDWKIVQGTLVHSDWARRYTDRAVAVIAMFDPNYDRGPKLAELRVRVWIRPSPSHRSRKINRHSGRNSPRRTA
jgi:hypothetical protein